MDVGTSAGSRRWGWLFPALWCGLIVLASSIPHIRAPVGLVLRDKLIHFGEYGVLGVLTAAALSELVSWRASVRAVVAFGFCVALGALDEVYQISMSGRASDYLDFAADGLGAAAGQLVLVVGRFRRGRS